MGLTLPKFHLEPISESDLLQVIAHMDPVLHNQSFLCAPEILSGVHPCSLHTTCRAVLMQRENCREGTPGAVAMGDWIIPHMKNVFH